MADRENYNVTRFYLDGTEVTSTAAELNLLDESNTEPADGAFAAVLRCAKAEYDFATDGGAISAIDLNVDLPDNAIIVSGFVDVVTTLTSATDAATIALHANSADDIVAAVAISAATDWDAGVKSIVPVATGATAIKLTALRAITATIAVEAVTAGKFNVYLFYVIGE
tara:strand:- start:1232 stop:1735 length:504 start_codon:yes stop_codon:yes gene_type:complete